MSYYPPNPPPPTPPSGAPAGPGVLRYWAGGLLIAAGFVTAVVVFAVGSVSSLAAPVMDHIFVETEVAGFTVAPGSEHQSWDLFVTHYQSPGIPSECSVTGPAGGDDSVPVRRAPLHYEVWDDETRWILAGQVQVREPGEHTIVCRTVQGARYGLWQGDHARTTEDMFFAGLRWSALIGSGTLVIGITLIVTNSVSRSAARRRSAAPVFHAPPRPPWGPPPAAYPPAAPPHPASHGEPVVGTGPWQPPEPPSGG
ncbi:hypothetical protein [Actinorugispora endophytica]|uniref:Uncharacterized protein n=1 Tax=Actinorugispora endophytica TaxID=1605990 RepID=A0A4R6V1Y1_9ACTN|nr:hypothetical protein [Actinorugispora endophytica]TDQ52062.1 hypothetical protein EV190_10843 [Actinorugispora endophytica]